MSDNSSSPSEDDSALFKDLAALTPVEYDRRRCGDAATLGIRVTTLDGLVEAERPKTDTHSDSDELVEGVEPWDKSVEGGELADHMAKTIKRHCVLSDHSVNASTLWIIASYGLDSFRIFAKLGVTSPQKRCGKTTFLETISALCNRALLSSNLTPAVLFRVIEEWQPTLIVDEMDTFIEGNEELRGIINSGHNRKLAYVMRVEGDANARTPRRFSTWTPTVLAKIGTFPDTIADRVIAILLERKIAGDVVERLPADLDDRCRTIRRQCQRWINDNQNRLSLSAPDTPDVNNDRAKDNWLPLLAVADLIGGNWPDKARAAMIHMESNTTRDDSDDIAIMLLHDIQKLVEHHRWTTTIPSTRLTEELNQLDERPWPSMRNDKGISTHNVAKMLLPFGLKSGSRRNSDGRAGTLKGYRADAFQSVCSRYLANTAPQSGTSAQPRSYAGGSVSQTGTDEASVPDRKYPKLRNHAVVPVCQFQRPLLERYRETAAHKTRIYVPRDGANALPMVVDYKRIF